MPTQRRMLLLGAAAGLAAWLAATALDLALLHNGADARPLVPPFTPHDLLTRAVPLATFIALGSLTGAHLARRQAARALRQSKRHLHQVAQHQALTARILDHLNRPGRWPDALEAIAHRLRAHLGFDAVGVRLRDGDDFPYYVSQGFAPHFLLVENRLCARGPGGEILRDEPGRPVLECLCGLVLSGRADPSEPFFTEGGSFWTNRTSALVDRFAQGPAPVPFRGRCHAEGYESVALVPIRADADIIGLMHLGDRRPDRFTPVLIRFFEHLGASLGIAFTRHRAEDALRASETRYRDLVEGTADLVVQLDGQGRILYVNPAITTLLGHTPEACIGRSGYDFVHPDDREATQQAFEAWVRDRAEHATHENRLLSASGQVRHLLWTFAFHYGDAGAVAQVNASGADLTERHHAEDHRRKLQARIHQAQRLESLGALAGGIAHDFNNLLTVVVGNSQLAAQALPPEHPTQTNLRRIAKAADRAADLTRQMLAYAGRGAHFRRTVRLNDLVATFGAALRPSLPPEARLHLHLADDLPPTVADADQVELAVRNLVTNASEALAGRPGDIFLRTGVAEVPSEDLIKAGPRTPPLGRYVFLEVADSGDGMDDATRARAFDPFFSTKATGRGLGLSAVLGIAQSHGGGVQADSTPGRGSTFRLLFPCPAIDVETPAPPPLLAPAVLASPPAPDAAPDPPALHRPPVAGPAVPRSIPASAD